MSSFATWRCRYWIVLMFPLLLAVEGCRNTSAGDGEKTSVVVQAAHPRVGPITEEIWGDAVLAPIAQAAIQARITAPVKRFYVQRGERVRAGQILATLEDQDLAATALDNKGIYTAAQGAYTTATSQQVPEELTQARLNLNQAKATLDLDEKIVKARTDLLAQGAIPGRDVDTAKATALQARAAYDIAEQKFNSIVKVGSQAALDTAEGQLASAKGKYLAAEAQLAYTIIRTPIAGVVTDRPLFAGETATAGTALVTVMDTSVLVAKVHLSQQQAQQLAVGAPAAVSVPGLDEPVPAKVSLVSPALDPGSTTVEVWLRADNLDGQLRVGTAVRAKITGRTMAQTIIIPVDAVQRSSESGGKMVLVVDGDGVAHKKNITLGIQTATYVQVIEGLSVSDNVITAGGYGLDDGSKVKVEGASGKADTGAKE